MSELFPSSYAHVVLNLPLAEPFTYRVDHDLRQRIERGCLVKIPFSNRTEVGCVVGFSQEAPADIPAGKIRNVLERVSPDYTMSEELFRLAEFISGYYYCSLGEALAAMSMVGFRDVVDRAPALYKVRADWSDATDQVKLTKRQREICTLLEREVPATRADLARVAGCSPALIAKLEQAGVLLPWEAKAAPAATGVDHFAAALEPTAEQRAALDLILPLCRESAFRVFLLHGITGSGKTEIYLQAMAECLLNRRTVLCLVPEISLTPQTVERFEERFREEIGVFHSHQSRSAKLALYNKITDGRIRIVIGARSAVFSPLPNLGLIVIDEEHDGSYKQKENPRYNARDTAIMRARNLDIPVILGSATPSLETYHNAREGKYELIRLEGRAAGTELPNVQVIDLTRQVVDEGNPSFFSRQLIDAVRARLAAGEQSILFLNRRGFSNFLFCPSCKWVARCEEDDVALTVHRRKSRGAEDEELDLFAIPRVDAESFSLRCHFCGSHHDPPNECPSCGSADLMSVGTGTQRIEEEIARVFPDARLLRMDQDTVRGKDGYTDAWEQMVRGDADIILGTQMIAKGLHLERVTLVGIVLADIGLFVPDFRAEERTFTLLTQVAGRAGRVGKGEVLLQTYMPNHAAVRFACRHDYEGFFADEMRRRRQWHFPPLVRLVAITISDADRERAWKAARSLGYWLCKCRTPSEKGLTINGPTVAPMARLGGLFRFRILIRGAATAPMVRWLARSIPRADDIPKTTRVTIDVDPGDLM